MTSRKKMTDRKDTLTNSEASFLKGTAKPKSSTTEKQATSSPAPSDIMAQILTPATDKEPITRFTADLPDSLHKRLTVAAAMSGKKKVDIVRELLDAALPQLPN